MRNPPPISTSSPRETITSCFLGKRVQRQERGGRTVIDDERGRIGFGGSTPPVQNPQQKRLDVHVPAAARAGFEIQFEVAVILRDLDDMFERGLAQRRAPQVGMQNDPGGIDHRPKGITLARSRELAGDALGQRIDALPAADFGVWRPAAISRRRTARNCARRSSTQSADTREQRLACGAQQQFVDGGKQPEEIAALPLRPRSLRLLHRHSRIRAAYLIIAERWPGRYRHCECDRD